MLTPYEAKKCYMALTSVLTDMWLRFLKQDIHSDIGNHLLSIESIEHQSINQFSDINAAQCDVNGVIAHYLKRIQNKKKLSYRRETARQLCMST